MVVAGDGDDERRRRRGKPVRRRGSQDGSGVHQRGKEVAAHPQVVQHLRPGEAGVLVEKTGSRCERVLAHLTCTQRGRHVLREVEPSQPPELQPALAQEEQLRDRHLGAEGKAGAAGELGAQVLRERCDLLRARAGRTRRRRVRPQRHDRRGGTRSRPSPRSRWPRRRHRGRAGAHGGRPRLRAAASSSVATRTSASMSVVPPRPSRHGVGCCRTSSSRAVLVGHQDLHPGAAEIQARDQSRRHTLSSTSGALDREDRALCAQEDFLRDASQDELSDRSASSQPDDDEVCRRVGDAGNDRLGRIVVRVQLSDVVSDAVHRQALRKRVDAMLCGDLLQVTRPAPLRC